MLVSVKVTLHGTIPHTHNRTQTHTHKTKITWSSTGRYNPTKLSSHTVVWTPDCFFKAGERDASHYCYVVCELKTHLHLHLFWMWSQWHPPPPLEVFTRSGSQSVLKRADWLQSNDRKHILMPGVKRPLSHCFFIYFALQCKNVTISTCSWHHLLSSINGSRLMNGTFLMVVELNCEENITLITQPKELIM